MEQDEIIAIQKKFAHYHRILYLVILIYSLGRGFYTNQATSLALSSLMIPFLLIEGFLLKPKTRVLYISIFRFLQLCCLLVLFVITNSGYTLAIITVCILIFSVEYYLTIDFLDDYNRNVGIGTISIVIVLAGLMEIIIKVTLNLRLFSGLLVSITCVINMLMIFAFLTYLVRERNNKLFAQSRLVEQMEDTNASLKENQEKVKRANELLGAQKIKLEAAYNKINSVNSEMMIQNQIVKYISSSLEISKLMSLITQSILEEIGVDVCAIVLYSGIADNEKVQFKVQARMSTAFVEHLKESIQNQCFDQFLLDKKTYIDNHVSEESYSFIKKGLVGSLIIVPLIKNEEIKGALFVGHPKYDFFVENQAFFEAIIAQFMIALDNAYLYSKMKYIATTDGLTGVFNRGYLTKLYQENLNEAIIEKSSLTLALLDIDKFKNVNDSYGHLFGDIVIKTIASITKKVADESDAIVGRYGGEEFVIMFPNKGLKDAYEIVEEIKESIKNTELEHNMEKIHVTVSVGITSYPETCRNPGELLNRADWAMYYSKQNGRDCITIDHDKIRKSVVLK